MLTEHLEALETTSRILLKRETIERNEFLALLDGKSEEDVFGPDDAPAPPTDGTAESAGEVERDLPRPTTQPGLAGGALEARGLDLPEKPEPA
jgi:cell division protease FtsH